jgi:erythromycin esterase
MTKRSTLVFLFLTQSFLGYTQSSPSDWLKKNTVEFTDFSFIDKEVHNKKFVFIGESSHGASEFYSFKAGLAEYLIKKHGFEVVAIESPFVASYFYDQFEESRSDTLSHAEHVLFPIFCNNTTEKLINKLDSSKIPVVGFDNQLGTKYQARMVTDFVFNKLAKMDTSIANEYLETNRLFTKDNIVRFSTEEAWFNYPCTAIKDNLTCEYWLSKYNKFVNFLVTNYDQLLSICNNDKLAALATLRSVQTVQADLITTIDKDNLNLRDSLMAKNIEFISTSMYPNKKIVFLAHNAHIAKNDKQAKVEMKGDSRTMVSYLGKNTIEKSLVLGLYGIEGSTNKNNRIAAPMTAADIDSTLEYKIKDRIGKQAYINLKKYPNLKTNSYINLSHWGIYPEILNPKEEYDYLIFIKHLTPSTYLNNQ